MLYFSDPLVQKCLSMQLEELEIISSIFCGPREVIIDDPAIIVDMQGFIDGEAKHLNRKLDYRVNVTLEGFKDRVEVFAELPHYYPALELPVVTVSYPNISSSQHNQLKSLVAAALMDLQQTEETFLFPFISWIQEAEDVQKVLRNKSVADNRQEKVDVKVKEERLERLWIYSHHIYSKRKRSSIIQQAKDLKLTGFSLPGKPGIICVEGYQKDTQEFWRIIKAMHWQRIQVRLEEKNENKEDLNDFRKFTRFDEETKFTVVNESATAGGDNDSDDDNNNNVNSVQSNDEEKLLSLNMSNFNTYLEQHKSSHVMNSLFGFK